MTSRTSKNHRAAGIASALAVVTLLILGSGWGAAQDERSEGSKSGIVGTWRVQVTTYDCATGRQNPPFASMLTFGEGGTLIETTSSPAFQPGQRSPGHGIWKHLGGHNYSAASEAYILFDSAPHPPAPVFSRGTQRIAQAVEIEDDRFESVASVEFRDVHGNLLTSGCANAVGERFK